MQSRNGRQGSVLSVRLTNAQRASLQEMVRRGDGPRAMGPYLVWRAIDSLPPTIREPVAGRQKEPMPHVSNRVILDLCGGTGAWSAPYREAGYRVINVTWPEHDVRTFIVQDLQVWGILAAPPCTEFSMAKNGQMRDFIRGMGAVNACLRIVMQAQPQWWALENPVGHLAKWLGPPAKSFEPYEYGDPWTKRTCLWGNFTMPPRGPHVTPQSGVPGCRTWQRAITPPGFAKAFFESNP